MASTFEPDAHTQADGTRYVTERHTDHLGNVHERIYRAPAGSDYGTLLAESAARLTDQLAEQEIAEVLRGA